MRSSLYYPVLILLFLVIYVSAEYLRMEHYIAVGTEMAEETVPYERQLPHASMQILVAGDSTGYGTGASIPEHSLAGLLGAKYPEASVTNISVNGARTEDLITQLQNAKSGYDLILIDIGGNDSIHFVPRKKIEENMREALNIALTKGSHVLLVSTGDASTIRLFPYPLRWMFGLRTAMTRDVFLELVSEYGGDIRYTDLFREKTADGFASDPKAYYARDYFHPSDIGYADWFTVMEPELDQFTF
jgi:lysophospholipase L1-like esterase